jgi:hypothetical protein
MELKDFVKETLTAIVQGVAEAQQGDYGGNISPAPSNEHVAAKGERAFVSSWGLSAHPVRFDVALTVTEGGKREGGGKVSVLAVSVGASGSSANEKQSVSRVQFEVPLAVPTTRKEPVRDKKPS